MLLLGELIFPQMPGLIPFITFGSLCLVAAILVLQLPETLDTKLPDTIEEAVAQARSPGQPTISRFVRVKQELPSLQGLSKFLLPNSRQL